MRSHFCVRCKTWTPSSEWNYGCPNCDDEPVDTHEVMPDIKPYKSMLTGELVNSRSQHRKLLKAHGCFEIGNETAYLVKPKPKQTPAKELLIAQVNEMGHERFKKALQNDLDYLRWNSRGRK